MAQKEEDGDRKPQGGGSLSLLGTWSVMEAGLEEGVWALELSKLDLNLGSASSRPRGSGQAPEPHFPPFAHRGVRKS